MKMRGLLFLIALSFVVLGLAGDPAAPQQGAPAARRVIVFVWDGLRADDVTPENMPNYFALARSGVVFADHHAVYPTFTMMNSASIATGTYAGMHGFYGNVVYAPNAKGKNAKGVAIDFGAPAFIEDFGVVEAVRDYVPRQAHACFDDAPGGTGQRADDSSRRQIRRRVHSGLSPRGHHSRRGRGDPAEFREGAPERRVRTSEEHRQRLQCGSIGTRW